MHERTFEPLINRDETPKSWQMRTAVLPERVCDCMQHQTNSKRRIEEMWCTMKDKKEWVEDKSVYLICTNYCIFSDFFPSVFFCHFLKFLVWFVYKISVRVVCRTYSMNAVVLLLDCDCDFVNYLLVFVFIDGFYSFLVPCAYACTTI